MVPHDTRLITMSLPFPMCSGYRGYATWPKTHLRREDAAKLAKFPPMLQQKMKKLSEASSFLGCSTSASFFMDGLKSHKI